MTFVKGPVCIGKVGCEATGRGWIWRWSASSEIVADGAGIDLIPCVAVARSIIWRWVVSPLPIGGMGPGIGVAGGI
jgi:hypothetical protein